MLIKMYLFENCIVFNIRFLYCMSLNLLINLLIFAGSNSICVYYKRKLLNYLFTNKDLAIL